MLDLDSSIVLIGATMADYIGTSENKFKSGFSNPGHLTFSYGGVGHNIALNLTYLGNKVHFITGIGKDKAGKEMLHEMEKAGIDVIYPEPKYNSSSYVAVLDEKGELKGGVSDVEATEAINFRFLQQHDYLIRSHRYIFLDTNLSSNVISDVLRYYPDKKLCIEAVSQAKVKKIKRFLPRIYLVKGNMEELRSLTSLKKDASGEDIVNELRHEGVQNAIATAGKDGIYFASPFETKHIPAEPIDKSRVVSAIGAGDALYAGFIHGFTRGWNFEGSLKFGEKLAKEVLLSKKATTDAIKKYASYEIEEKTAELKKKTDK